MLGSGFTGLLLRVHGLEPFVKNHVLSIHFLGGFSRLDMFVVAHSLSLSLYTIFFVLQYWL